MPRHKVPADLKQKHQLACKLTDAELTRYAYFRAKLCERTGQSYSDARILKDLLMRAVNDVCSRFDDAPRPLEEGSDVAAEASKPLKVPTPLKRSKAAKKPSKASKPSKSSKASKASKPTKKAAA